MTSGDFPQELIDDYWTGNTRANYDNLLAGYNVIDMYAARLRQGPVDTRPRADRIERRNRLRREAAQRVIDRLSGYQPASTTDDIC